MLNLRKTLVFSLTINFTVSFTYTTDVAAKANHLLGLIRKSFDYLDPDMLVKLFVIATFVCLLWNSELLQFGRGPLFILDQRIIKKVQRTATRLLSPIRDRSYGERLLILQLPSLAYRHLRGDMILLLYKILHNYFSSDFSTIYTYPITRSRLNCRSNYFLNRLINDWNNLLPFVINANSVNSFKFI